MPPCRGALAGSNLTYPPPYNSLRENNLQLRGSPQHLSRMPENLLFQGNRRFPFVLFVAFAFFTTTAVAQQALPDAPQSQSAPTTGVPSDNPTGTKPGESGQHRILWVIPNYRSDELGGVIKPLSTGAKFKLAFEDSFDPSAFLVAGVFAGISMANVQYPDFGVGAVGFGKYYGGAFADQAIGNMMTEAIFPSVLHQDPRYFVMGRGGFWKRTKYAISREVITRTDAGTSQFNISEIAGNGIAAGISNIYYPDAQRTVGDNMKKWGQQLALDTFFDEVKEFWPDVRHKLFKQ